MSDAARTCVLSSKWRYVWANHPSLVLEKGFWEDIKRHKSPEKFDSIHYANDIVSSILLCHFGHIRKFVIDVSAVRSNVDLWVSSLCRRSLKVLDLKNSIRRNCYEVPSWVFLSSELTHLSLSYCSIKSAFGCFTNIQSLFLEYVSFDSIILTTPLLTSLTMKRCYCNSLFGISAPRLASLTLDCNNIFNLKPFFTCTDMEYAFLCSYGDYVESDGKHLVELLALWPRMSLLTVDANCFKFGKKWMNDIDEPSKMDFKMDQLRTVKMKNFTASRNQVMFVKILLKCAPLLGKMLVEENEKLDPKEQIKIVKELFSLQREYRKTEIILAPNLVPV